MNRSFRAAELREIGALKIRDNKDEDLAFFREMRKRVKERKNLRLSQNTHQFDASLGPVTSAPARKKWIFEFLNSNNHKNEYDWLITPPDTPAPPLLIKKSEQTVRSQIGTPNARTTACKPRVTKPQLEPLGRINSSSRQQVSIPKPNLSIRFHKHEGRGSVTGILTDHSTMSSTYTTLTRSMCSSSRSSALPRVSTSNVKKSSRLASKSTSRRPNIAPCTIDHVNASPLPKPTLKNMKQSRPSSPSERLKLWNPSEMPGFSFDVPPNLRTFVSDRSPSVTRGRPGAPSSSGELVTSSRTRKQSVGLTNSMSVNRLHSKTNGNISSSSVSSKMVGSGMNMRKLVSAKKQSLFRNLSMKSCSIDIERCLSNKSLDVAMKHMDMNKSVKENVWPTRSRASKSSMYSARSVPTGSVSI